MLDEKNKLPEEESKQELSNSTEQKVSEIAATSQMPKEEVIGEAEAVKQETVEDDVDVTKAEEIAVPASTDEKEDEVKEKEQKQEVKEELPDYSVMSLEELVEKLQQLVNERPVQEISKHVNAIKAVFNNEYGKLLSTAKEKFLADGGNIIDFRYENPLKSTYNDLLYHYRQKRNKYQKAQEAELQQNLERKLALIEELKALIETADSKTMYQDFQAIQTRWREVGSIPRTTYNDTWQTYHHHVERFYDLLHLNKDLRDLDFKHNLEKKLKLVEKAEELTTLQDANEAFRELQTLHKVWKEEVGPVDRIHREEVWNRFSEATKKIHDKRHEHFRELKAKYQENIDAKLAVVKEMQAYDVSNNTTRAHWKESIDKMEAFRKVFFDAGYVPKGKGDEVWDKFREVNKNFNRLKNQFFKEAKKEYSDNIAKKQALIDQAVSLKDSEDFEATVEVFKKIQADWKHVGQVPRKHSNKLWKEFKDACNHFFDRYHASKDEANEELMKVYHQKKEYLDKIKEEVSEGLEITHDKLQEYIANWRDMGRVPQKVRHIEGKFNKFLDKLFENLSINRKDAEMIKFKNEINSHLEQEDYRKLNSEQAFLRKKIDETVREIQQLENNISFISNASSDSPLLKNVNKNIDKHKRTLEEYQDKLRYLSSLDY